MDRVVPWRDLVALIEPFAPESGRRGQQPFAGETLLLIHFMHVWTRRLLQGKRYADVQLSLAGHHVQRLALSARWGGQPHTVSDQPTHVDQRVGRA